MALLSRVTPRDRAGRRARRLAQLAVVAAMVVGVAGCSDDESSEPAATPSASAPGPSDDELSAKVVAGVPPEDVVWNDPQVPSGWKRLSTDQGTAQWQVGSSTCIVGLDQPAGVGTAESPTDEEVLDRQVQQIGQAAGGVDDLSVSDGSVMVPAAVKGSTATVEQKFVTREFSTRQARGVVRAHRFGDFALIAYTACGPADFDQADDPSIETFLDSLTLTLTY